MVYYDIFIPSYFHDENDIRYGHTIKIFKYMSYIREKLKKIDIYLSFTVVGSNGHLSKNIFDECFKDKDDIYLEFKQNYKPKMNIYVLDKEKGENIKEIKAKNQGKILFNEMLDKKFYLGWMTSMKKKKNISFLMGSNDLISIDFFKKVREEYNPKKNQVYGLNKNKNLCLYLNLDENLKLGMDLVNARWNLNYQGFISTHDRVEYGGGIFGLNNYKKYWRLFLKKSWNEVYLERVLRMNNFQLINISDCFYLNIKTGNDMTEPMDNNAEISEKLMRKVNKAFKIYNNL